MPRFTSTKNILLQSDFVRDENGEVKNGPDGLPLQSQVHCQGEYDFNTREWVFDLTDAEVNLFGAALAAEGAVKVADASAPVAAADSAAAPDPAQESQPTNPDGSVISTPEGAPSDPAADGLNFGIPDGQ